MAEPLFSIITVCYNASDTIDRTLSSVDSQSFTDYEHLIIDGNSTDGTQKLVEDRPNQRRQMVSEPDKGIYDAMNKGMSFASGRYLIFLNAGDSFHDADVLADYARLIQNNDEPAVVYGQTNLVDKDGTYLGPRHLRAPQTLTLASFSEGMVVCHQAFVALKRIVGFFNLKYRYSADYEWCIRCLQHSRKNVGLGDTVVIDYLSEGLTTKHQKASLIERFKIMRYYYGLIPTLRRHIGFYARWRKRQKQQ